MTCEWIRIGTSELDEIGGREIFRAWSRRAGRWRERFAGDAVVDAGWG